MSEKLIRADTVKLGKEDAERIARDALRFEGEQLQLVPDDIEDLCLDVVVASQELKQAKLKLLKTLERLQKAVKHG